eukprot:15472936-Alexandrium_andersonii.AAC.1
MAGYSLVSISSHIVGGSLPLSWSSSHFRILRAPAALAARRCCGPFGGGGGGGHGINAEPVYWCSIPLLQADCHTACRG